MKSLTSLFLIASLVSLCAAWTQVNPINVMKAPSSFVYGGGAYVMVQQDLETNIFNVSYSSDGLNWTPSVFPYFPASEASVVYANGLFYAILYGHPFVFTSSNGAVFAPTKITDTMGSQIEVLSNGFSQIFVTLDYEGELLVSTDGFNWTTAANPVAGKTAELYTAGNVFILTTEIFHPQHYISTDGFIWNRIPTNGLPHQGLTNFTLYGGQVNEIIAITLDNELFRTTTQGQIWTSITNNLILPPVNLFYGAGSYAAVLSLDFPYTYALYTSPDLITWTQTSSAYGNVPWFPSTYFPVNTQVVSVGLVGYAITSNFQTWSYLNLGITENWNNVYVLTDGTVVFEGSYNYTDASSMLVYYSTPDNGQTFQQLPIPPFDGYYQTWETSGTFNFLINFTIFTTSDFKIWKGKLTINTPCEDLFDLATGNGIWLGVCNQVFRTGGKTTYYITLIMTKDPIFGPWTTVLTTNFTELRDRLEQYDVAFGNNLFLFKVPGKLYSSANGVNWTEPDTTQTYPQVSTVTYVGKLFYLITNNAVIGASLNGVWSNVTVPIDNVSSIKYISATPPFYVALGDGHAKVATSFDGLTWTLSDTFSIPAEYVVTKNFVYNGEVFIATDYAAGIYVMDL